MYTNILNIKFRNFQMRQNLTDYSSLRDEYQLDLDPKFRARNKTAFVITGIGRITYVQRNIFDYGIEIPSIFRKLEYLVKFFVSIWECVQKILIRPRQSPTM